MTWLKHVIKALRPWPSKSDRQAALQSAAAEKTAAAKRAGHARQVAQSIEDLVYHQNNWAAIVAHGLGIPNGDRNGDRK